MDKDEKLIIGRSAESLNRDADILRRNVEAHPLAPADFVRFLSECSRLFGPAERPEPARYPRALI